MKAFYLTITFMLTILCGSLKSQNCTVNAGIDQSNCITLPTELKGNASGLFSTAAHWVLASGPSLKIENPDSMRTKVTGYKGGNIYTFKIVATCKDGTNVSDQVAIKISETPSNVDAGTDQTVCTINSLTVNLSASSLDSNQVGYWQIASGGTGSFSDSTSNKTKFTLSGNNCIAATNITLRWTVTNGRCSISDDVKITYIGGAPVDAGTHQDVSCATKIRLNGSCPGTEKQVGTWSIISGPGGGTFANKNTYNTTLGDLKIGTYLLKWSVSGPCVTNDDTVTITILSIGIITVSSSGTAQNYCVGNLPTSFSISASPADSGITGIWSQTSGSKVSIINKDSAITNVTGISNTGSYSFKWTLSRGLCVAIQTASIIVAPQLLADAGPDIVAECGASSATMAPKSIGGTWNFISGPCTPGINKNYITKLYKPGLYKLKYTNTNTCGQSVDTATVTVSTQPSNSKAGTDQIFACNIVSGTLAANIPSAGNGTWSQISGPTNAKFSDIHNPSSNLTGLVGGRYYMKWEIDGGAGCPTTSDEVIIYVSTASPTKANAGTDQTICKNSTLMLNGNTPNRQEIGTWSQIAGTAVTIDSPFSESCFINGFIENNIYKFVWNISNACGSTSDTISVTVIPDSKVSSDTSYCNASSITINGNDPGAGTGFWTQVNGPQCNIVNPNQQKTLVQNMTPGIYKFQWTITTGKQSNSSIIKVTNDAPVKAFAGKYQSINLSNSNTVNLKGNTPDLGNGLWSLMTGEKIKIESPNSPLTQVSGISVGDYKFRWTVTNGVCSNFSDVKINVYNHPTTPIDSNFGNESDSGVYIPNAFTPNADGLNDKFGPVVLGQGNYTMLLFNRWGEQIYTGGKQDGGWDGTIKEKECPQDVYIYEIVYEKETSQSFKMGETYRGTFTLLR